MNREIIASRANEGNKEAGVKFYKSYVTGIKLAEVRKIPEHVAGYVEEDYFFNYKGKTYRVNEHIVPNKDGVIKFSAKYRYTLEELK